MPIIRSRQSLKFSQYIFFFIIPQDALFDIADPNIV